MCRGLALEELALQPPRLCGGQSGRTEDLHDFVGELALLRRERRNVSAPRQACPDVVVQARPPSQLVRDPVKLAHLVEQRFEPLVVDPHRAAA
jgi:hypothetical protein